MNKEQFKKSISELVDYLVGQIAQANVMAAQNTENEALLNMAQRQAQAASMSFEQGLDQLINEVLPDRKAEEDEN